MIQNVFQSWTVQKPLLLVFFKPVRAEQLHCVDYSIGGPQQTTSKSVHILTKVFMFFQMNLWLYLNDIYSIEPGHFLNMAEWQRRRETLKYHNSSTLSSCINQVDKPDRNWDRDPWTHSLPELMDAFFFFFFSSVGVDFMPVFTWHWAKQWNRYSDIRG